MMQKYALPVLFSLSASILTHASPLDHLKKIENKTQKHPFNNIDSVYLINLEQRPEKLRYALSQLKKYQIYPCHFPAIYGWNLGAEILNDIGLKFTSQMMKNQWAVRYYNTPLQAEFKFLDASCTGQTLFSSWISLGAIGCTLSHLSVLQDAFEAGHETIWVMEDDIDVVCNPIILSELIDELDRLVGKEGWDILYTDLDTQNANLYDQKNDFESTLRGTLWYLWRPDRINADLELFRKREYISEDFLKIGSRMRTHSMIIRRSGIQKILTYEKEHGIFIPYDHEIAMVPEIKLFCLKYPVVTFLPSISDTEGHHFR